MPKQRKFRQTLGIIGLGYWGEKILRASISLGLPVLACDTDPKRVRALRRQYPGITVAPHADVLFTNPAIDVCIIATPPLSHYALARAALYHHKHVLIEKPMTLRSKEAKLLVALARRNNLILMVDHVYLFSPIVHQTKKLLRKGTIGDVRRIHSVRHVGRIHPGSSVLWDLAPHDIALSSYLLNAFPRATRVLTSMNLENGVPGDVLYALMYGSDIQVICHVSWTTPVKKRSMEIIGTRGSISLSWDNGEESITVYKTDASKDTTRAVFAKRRAPRKEPLQALLIHMLRVIKGQESSRTSGLQGYNVTRVIEAIHRSLKKNGATVRLSYP